MKNHLLLKIALVCLIFFGAFAARGQCPDITGFYSVCLGSSTSLSNTSAGGIWSSSNTTVATVNNSGVVFSASAGATEISYTGGCGVATTTVTVQTAAPGPITGTVSPCTSGFTNLANSVAGGVWSSSNTAIADINGAGIVSGHAIGSATITYTTGCGSPVTRTITFTSRSPLYIYGPTVNVISAVGYLCIGATTTLSSDAIPAGTWTSNNPGIATINSTTGVVTSSGVAGTAVITVSNACYFISRYVNLRVANPTAISGNLTICGTGTTLLSNGTSPGTWSSGNTTLATVDPLTGEAFGTGAGTGTVPVTYTYAGGCSVTSTLTIPPAPVITGNAGVCVTGTTTLSSGAMGGTWSSGNTSVATVSNTGIVTGVSLGNAVITYTNSCGSATYTVAVASPPGPIGGPDPHDGCTPYFVQLTNSVAGGTWSSSNTNVGVISSGGALTGSTPGSVIGSTVVTYSTGCGAVSTRTITTTRSAPTTIYGFTTPVGALHLCAGAMITLSNDGIPTGTWSSNNTSVIVINPITGVMTTAGLGTVIVTGSNVCGGRGLNVVVEAPTAISGNMVICGSTTTTLSNGTALGTWSSGNTSLATIDQNGVVHAVPGGGYGVVPITYTLLGGCFTNTNVLISASPSVIAGSRIVCVGSTIIMSNSSPGGTWSSSATGVATVNSTGAVTGIAAGTAVISYANACGVATATVTVGGTAATPIAGNLLLCGALTTTLSNSTSPGTWSSGNTALATIEPTTGIVHVIPGSGTGVVPVTYTAVGACAIATTTLTITVSMSVIGGVTNICVGNSMPLSNASPNGTWSSSATNVATINLNTGIVTGVAAGTALITYTSDCGFTTASVTVSGIPSISGLSTLCSGGSLSLSNASGSGTWSSGSPGVATVSTGGVVTGVSGGTATISYTIASGCSAMLTVTVNPMPGPIIGATTICVGGAVILSNNVGGGSWYSGNTSVASISATGTVQALSPGVAVIIYNIGSCSAISTVTVVSTPANITGSTQVCNGMVTNLSNAVAGGVWTSASPAVASVTAGGVVTGGSVGSATISYTIGGGCIAVTTVTVNAGPANITGNTSLCTGSTSSLSNTTAGGTWSSSTTNVTIAGNTISGSAAGTSIVSYTMLGGCYKTATITVLAAPGAILGSGSVCIGSTIVLSNAVAGGTWSSGAPLVATVSAGSGNVSGVAVGTAVISYTTGPGCLVTASVIVLPSPGAGSITGPSVLCGGDTITLSNQAAGGVWSVSSTAVATVSTSGEVIGSAAGSVIVSYTISSPCGAVAAVKTLTVQALPDAGVITGPNNLCAGTSIILSNAITGGVWSSGSTLVSVAGDVVNGLSAGNANISYIITNSCGADTATWVLAVDAAPNAGSIDGPDSVCAGAVFALSETVTGGVWTSSSVDATINSSTGQVHALSEGVVTISYTASAAGSTCVSVATHTLTIGAPTFAIHAVVTDVTCRGAGDGSISVTINGGVPPHTYTWSTAQNTATINNLVPGVYILNVGEAATQCIKDTAFTVTEPDSIIIKDAVTNDLCGRGMGAVTLQISGGTPSYSYLWSNSETTKDIQGVHSGVYTVTVTDGNNCSAQHSMAVKDSSCKEIVIHDAITPNGDGINDVWVIEGIEAYRGSTVHVFDKWGDAVFEKTNYANDWDGRGKKGLLPDGTYFYLVKLNATNVTGGNDSFTGTILIKR